MLTGHVHTPPPPTILYHTHAHTYVYIVYSPQHTQYTWTCLVVLTSEILETPPIKHKPPRCPWLLTLFTAEHIRNTVTSCPGVVCGMHVYAATATHTNNKKQTKKTTNKKGTQTINRSVTENVCCQGRRHTLKVH